MKHLAVIGAGAAGLAAARALEQKGFTVTIYEKSQSVGGRVTTRRVNGCIIDHGAQVVQTPTPEMRQLVTAGTPDADDTNGETGQDSARDIARPVWTFDAAGAIGEGDPALNAQPKWCWPDGINRLCQKMAAGLDIRFGVHVHSLAATPGGYSLRNQQGKPLGSANAVLLTPPAPQTAAIIGSSALPKPLKDRLTSELATVTYRRCLSLALAYARRPTVPWYALVNTDRQHPIAWLGCEHDKPGHAPDKTGLLIAQMAHDFSVQHWDEAEKGTYGASGQPFPLYMGQVHEYVQELLETSLGAPLWVDLHRWRYALPDHGKSTAFDALNRTDTGLYFAGDYIEGRGRISEVIACGWRVAEQL